MLARCYVYALHADAAWELRYAGLIRDDLAAFGLASLGVNRPRQSGEGQSVVTV
jgi:hypothetical protein